MSAVDCLGMNIDTHLCVCVYVYIHIYIYIYIYIFLQILPLGEKLTCNDYKSESVRKNY